MWLRLGILIAVPMEFRGHQSLSSDLQAIFSLVPIRLGRTLPCGRQPARHLSLLHRGIPMTCSDMHPLVCVHCASCITDSFQEWICPPGIPSCAHMGLVSAFLHWYELSRSTKLLGAERAYKKREVCFGPPLTSPAEPGSLQPCACEGLVMRQRFDLPLLWCRSIRLNTPWQTKS